MTSATTPGGPAAAPLVVRLTQRLESASALDGAVAALAPLADALLRSPARRDALQGMWLGHAVHPLMTFLPLGSWTSASVLDLLGGAGARPAARLLVGFGILTAVPTAVTGLAEWGSAGTRDRRTGLVHAASNNVGLVLYARSWAARRRGDHRRGALLALAGAGATGVGGYLGGHLTEARKVSSRHPAFAADDAPASLRPD